MICTLLSVHLFHLLSRYTKCVHVEKRAYNGVMYKDTKTVKPILSRKSNSIKIDIGHVISVEVSLSNFKQHQLNNFDFRVLEFYSSENMNP